MNESSLSVITRDNIGKPTVIDALSVIKPGNTMKDTLVSWRHREMDLGVSTLKARIVKDKRCPVCTLSHLANTMSAQTNCLRRRKTRNPSVGEGPQQL